jgi:NitT/TauT family transport system permease protein
MSTSTVIEAPAAPVERTGHETLVERVVDEARRERRRRRGIVIAGRIGLLVALVGGWQLLGGSSRKWELLVSTPGDVTSQMRELMGESPWWSDLWSTVQVAFLGYLLGVAVAIVLVAVIVPAPLLARFAAPFIACLNALPKVALAPVFIILFGFTMQSKVVFVAAATFFVVFYGVYEGVRSIDRVYIDNTRLLGASRVAVVRQVYAPAIVSWVMASLRASSAWAFTGAVVAEYLGSNSGIGFRIGQAEDMLDNSSVLANTLAIAVVAVLVDRIFVLIERRASMWRVF